ncbi:Cetn4 [Symbiodinium necroappetens]|uniref:Cetn4 protein n=1 Tax=Symbiodinium necroappetens TaxID=1628268 RepID=A0A813B242_9DINO|nr:Cetn4 [Symbiodinium necroappetens]
MRASRRGASKLLTVLACLYCLRHLWGTAGSLPFTWKFPWPWRSHHVSHIHGHHSHHQPEHDHPEHEESIFEEFVEEVVLCPWLLFAEISVVVMLNACFESIEHWVRHSLGHAGDHVGLKIMDVLFKEFSGLGFIGMFLFLMTQSHVTEDILGKKVFGDSLKEMEAGDPIAESFETVHMMIFLLMAVLLFQAMALLRVTKTVIETWGRYERARAWGLRQDSLESLFCESGYLERVAVPHAPRGMELHMQESFTYDVSFLRWMVLHHDTLHSLVMWRAIRHQFIFGAARGKSHSHISCPRQFSFEAYLRERLGHIVVCVVEVDMWIWLTSLVLLTPVLYGCIHLDLFAVGEFLCMSAYFLLMAGVVVGYLLEHDTLSLTPTLPEDARKILLLFSGTSTNMLMKQYDVSSTVNAELKFGAPGLCNVEMEKVELGPTPAANFKRASLSTEWYAFIFELLAFWQAIQVTCLVLFYLSVPFTDPKEMILYAMAWAEWPLMLFGVMPVLLERLTIRSSIGDETDNAIVRQVSLETKSGLLRYHIRLAQLMGYEKRVKRLQFTQQNNVSASTMKRAHAIIRAKRMVRKDTLSLDAEEPTVTKQSSLAAKPKTKKFQSVVRKVQLFNRMTHEALWSKKWMRETWQRGLRLFRALPYSEQHEIEQIFGSLDINNNEEIMLGDLAAHWKAMGFPNSEDAAHALLDSIDHDGSKQLTWSKFQAVAALAIAPGDGTDSESWQDDYMMLFNLIDQNCTGRLTVFDITTWLEDMKSGMSEMDVASLLYQHFGQAKPYVDQREFLDWIASIGLPHHMRSHSHSTSQH